MAFPTYSTRIIDAAALVGETTTVVPDGYLYVVRCITVVFNTADVVCLASVYIGDGPAFFAVQEAVSGQLPPPWNGRVVVTEGETIVVDVYGSDSADVTVSGYALTMP